MKLVLCTMCEGGALYNENASCIQCDDMEVYHIQDTDLKEDHVIVPCSCPACSQTDRGDKP